MSLKNFSCLVSVKEKPGVFCEELTLCVLFRWNAFLTGLNDGWTRIQMSVNYTYYVVLFSISSPGLGEYFSCATTDSFRILSFSSLTNAKAAQSELPIATYEIHKSRGIIIHSVQQLHEVDAKWRGLGCTLGVVSPTLLN
jgi:hypothetical protein